MDPVGVTSASATASSDRSDRPTFQLSPTTIAMLGVAALAWAAVLAIAVSMGNSRGTMGLSFGAFVGMWSLMMAAMMLPAVAPVASLYLRTLQTDRRRRVSLFVAGYLVVWATSSVPAWFALVAVDRLTMDAPSRMRWIAAAILVVAAVYQLSPLKNLCLRHCRSPLGQLLHYANVKGRFRDLKVAVHHAAFCIGCCWALMALFVAFGVMNVWVMFGLAAIVVAEKTLRRGETIGRLAGVVFFALAVAITVSPTVAERVVPGSTTTMGM